MPDNTTISGHARRRILFICGVVFIAAVALRVLFLVEFSSSPTYRFPILDSAEYDRVARELAFEGRLDRQFSWQGFLYPLFLAGIYAATQGSLLAARLSGAVLSGMASVVVFLLGRRLYGERTGIIAALITVLYGPLLFFQIELLATGLAVLTAPLLVYVTHKLEHEVKWVTLLLLGIIAGAATLVRATFAPFAICYAVLLAFRLRSLKKSWKAIVGMESIAIAGAIAVLAPASLISGLETRHYSPIPRSGSLNLYIGNNPDMERTIAIRPGWQWDQLLAMPVREGRETEKEYRQYFLDRVAEYASTQPVSFAAGLLKKSLHFFSSREIPRNFDIYAVSEYSRLLSALVWKSGRFGFPFGVFLPLALYGLYIGRKSIPASFWLFTVVYPLSVILVFSTARYRAPLIPVLSIPVAAGLIGVYDLIREKSFRRLGFALSVMAAVAFFSSAYGPHPTERHNYSAEMHCCVGYNLSLKGEHQAASEYVRKALDIDPEYTAANRIMGCILHELGSYGEAIGYFEKALASDPESYVIHYYMCVSHLNLGLTEKADYHLEKAAEGASRSRDERIMQQLDRILASRSEVR